MLDTSSDMNNNNNNNNNNISGMLNNINANKSTTNHAVSNAPIAPSAPGVKSINKSINKSVNKSITKSITKSINKHPQKTINYTQDDHHIGSVQVPYKFQSFLSLVIFGYFGIKIFLAWFKIYPKKYYQKKILINTCNDGKNTKNIVMNGYVPGLWNSEITDFVITIVLASITFVFTDMTRRGALGEYGSVNWFFLLGYMIGLNAPVFKEIIIPFLKDEYDDSYKILSYILVGVVVLVILTMIFLSARGARELEAVLRHKGLGMYIVYLIGIITIVVGLVIFRKKGYSNQKVVYDININNKCDKQKTETIKMSSDQIYFSMTMLAWLLSLIFVYDPPGIIAKYSLYLVNGIVLGVFVSGMSYYGIEYLLRKVPASQGTEKEKCTFPDDVHNDKSDKPEIAELAKKTSKLQKVVIYLKWLIGGVSCILIALIIQNYYGQILSF